MKYLLLIHGDEAAWESLNAGERQTVVDAYADFARRARDNGSLLRGEQLHPTERATTVRVVDGETVVTDGPYAETKEALGGYFLVEADSIDEAVELSRQLPPSRTGGVEVRPVHQDEGGEAS